MEASRLARAALLLAASAELACIAGGNVECSKIASIIGSSAGGVFVAVVAYTLWQGPAGLRLALAMVMAASSAGFLKQVIGAPRPPSEYWLVEAEGPSFPSGHATGSTALAASLALSTRLDPLVTIALTMHAVAVSLSRLVLRVHYPVDVAAGLILGSAVAVAVHMLWARSSPRAAVMGVGAFSTVLGFSAMAAGTPYRDLGVITGAGLGLAVSALALGVIEGWERCVEARISWKARLLAFTMAVAASFPVALSNTTLTGLITGFSVGLVVPLSRLIACRLEEHRKFNCV